MLRVAKFLHHLEEALEGDVEAARNLPHVEAILVEALARVGRISFVTGRTHLVVGLQPRSNAVVGALDLVQTLKGSEEHTSELQSLMRSSYDVICLKKNKSRNDLSCTGYW